MVNGQLRKSGRLSAQPLTLRRTLASGAGMLVVFAAASLFYRTPWAGLLLSPLGLLLPGMAARKTAEWRSARMRDQFKEALHCIATSLSAGRSVENAFLAVPDELKLLYPDPHAPIRVSFERIRIGLRNGDNLEACLSAFAASSGIPEAAGFVEVVVTARRAGGDIVGIVRSAAQLIGEKMDVERELRVMTAQKRFEARMMMAAPFVFVTVLTAAAPDYMAPLYRGIGYIILTAALAVLTGCAWLVDRWMRIDI